LDELVVKKDQLTAHLLKRYESLFGVGFEFLLYDVTSTFFEAQGGGLKAARGHSRDKRPDCKQVCIGLVVSSEGLPLAYEVFAGNRSDVTTVQEIVTMMESKYGKAKRIWVMDRGMVSQLNLDFLKQRQAYYVVGTRKSELKKYQSALLDSKGWHKVRLDVEVKLIEPAEGTTGDQLILCRSAARQQKEKGMLARQEQRLLKKLIQIRAMHLTQPPSIYCGSGQRRKGDRLHLHRLLSQSVEKLASGGRFAPVETEREFVQVIVQMVVANRSLVGPKQPPFEQREHPMRSGQEVFALSVSLDLSVVDVALQLSIGVQPVGSDRAARFDRLGNEAVQSPAVEIWDAPQTDASDASTVLLGGYDDQSLFVGQSTDHARFLSSPISLVDFDHTPQPIPAWPYHCSPQLVEQSPSGPVAPKTQHPLQAQGTDTIFLTRHVPHRSKPRGQRQVAVLENRACGNRRLIPTGGAQPKPVLHCPCLGPGASGTAEPLWPAKRKEVLPTRSFGAEALFHFPQSSRKIFDHPSSYCRLCWLSQVHSPNSD